MKNVLIVSGHTDLAHDSVVNKTIIETLQELVDGVQVDILDALYPDFKIDVPTEQAKLVAADVIVLQFPVFWYHMPSLMERWMERCFVRGFSHGSGGDKLKRKKVVLSFTTGAPEEAYRHSSPLGLEIEDIIIPAVKATCRLTQMDFVGYVFTGGVSYGDRKEHSPQIIQKARRHAQRVAEIICGL